MREKKSGREKRKRQGKRVTWSTIDGIVERVSYLPLHFVHTLGKGTKKQLTKLWNTYL